MPWIKLKTPKMTGAHIIENDETGEQRFTCLDCGHQFSHFPDGTWHDLCKCMTAHMRTTQ